MGEYAEKRIRSDYFSVVGFEQEQVKTINVDIDRDIDTDERFMAVTGPMHNLHSDKKVLLEAVFAEWLDINTRDILPCGFAAVTFFFAAVTMRGYDPKRD